jgi:hypothetical protein
MAKYKSIYHNEDLDLDVKLHPQWFNQADIKKDFDYDEDSSEKYWCIYVDTEEYIYNTCKNRNEDYKRLMGWIRGLGN